MVLKILLLTPEQQKNLNDFDLQIMDCIKYNGLSYFGYPNFSDAELADTLTIINQELAKIN